MHERSQASKTFTIRLRTRIEMVWTQNHFSSSSLDSEDDFRSGCRNISHQQQSFSGLSSLGRSHQTKYSYSLLLHYYSIGIIYFLLTEREDPTGRISPEVLLVERTKAIFSQYGLELLVRVNKKFIIWFSLTIYFSAILPALCQPDINIAHNARGQYEKIWPRVLANHSARYIFTCFTRSSHIIIVQCIVPLDAFWPMAKQKYCVADYMWLSSSTFTEMLYVYTHLFTVYRLIMCLLNGRLSWRLGYSKSCQTRLLYWQPLYCC